MASKRDHYEVLGVPKTATITDIKTAYRRLARQHHPDIDKSPGAGEKFKEISEAYQILSDSEKRKMYDQFGNTPFEPGGSPFGAGGPFGGFRTYTYTSGNPNIQFDFGGFEDPFDLFEQIFGMGGMGYGRNYRRTPTYEMEISFDEAIHGATKEIEITDSEGKVKRMRIKVPAGVDNGTRVRFEGIDIIFRTKRHPEFLREGPDIFSEKLLTIPQIVLGDVVEVNTVWGPVQLKIPAGTEPGSLIRIKSKGAPTRNGGKGDHYVRIKLEVPQKPTSQERQLYEQLANLGKSKKKNWF